MTYADGILAAGWTRPKAKGDRVKTAALGMTNSFQPGQEGFQAC